MPTFVFTYRTPPGLTRTPESAKAWMTWFNGIGDHLTDIGKPATESSAVGNCGPGTELSGYSLISAADLDEALAVTKGCPSLARDGGVEVAQLGEVPAAARTGDRAS
jgi:hypothetical protein